MVFKCDRCSKLFRNKTDFTRHKKRKIPCNLKNGIDKNFQCPKCDRSYTTKGNLTRHINNSHAVKLPFPIPPNFNLKSSNDSSHIDYNYEIDSDHMFNDAQNEGVQKGNILEPKRNILTQKGNNFEQVIIPNQEIICNYCKKTYSSKKSLHRHIKQYCKVKREMDKEKESIYCQLLDKMKKIEEQNEQIIKENKKLKSQNRQLYLI